MENRVLMVSINQLLTDISGKLLECCSSALAATQEAWWLLEKVTKQTKAQLLLANDATLTHEQSSQLQSWLNERIRNKKPLAYILGSVPFCDLDIIVQPPILIPRPETEELVTWLVKQLEPVKDKKLSILDLCTGSGCIALALARALPAAKIIGVDINPQAIALAESNKNHNRITNVLFVQSDLFASIEPTTVFDLIVSNPPYVTESEYTALSDDVRLWEDKRALIARDQGLEFYKRIAMESKKRLAPESILSPLFARIVVELGRHSDPVAAIFKAAGFAEARLYNDMQHVPRWLGAYV
jgi:release factor glutamine methyltransferase